MRKIRLRKIYFLPLSFLLLLTCKVQAQSVDAQKAISLIQKNIAASGLTPADLQNSRVSDAYVDKISGATLVYLQQTYQGVDVDKHINVFAFKNDALVSALGKRYPTNFNPAAKVVTTAPSISASDAVRAAASKLNIVISSLAAPVSAKTDGSKETSFGNVGKISNVSAKLIWATDQKSIASKTAKGMVLCWAVNLAPDDSVNAWRVKVDAASGKIIGKENYTVSDNWGHKKSSKSFYTVEDNYSNHLNANNFATGGAGINSADYRVVKFPAEAPSFPGGTPQIHTNPWELAGAGNNATTLKWNYDGTFTFDSTRGNNVWAQLNWNSPNSLTPVADGAAYSSTPAPDLTFNFVPDFSKQPTDSANRNFAVTNLFYWNNIMHDVSYQYGFDEVSGNFQQNNLSRGGIGDDYVIAFAQDGKGISPYTNNANFYTPVDGSRPRMRMYLFDAQASTTTASLQINKPSVLAGDKVSVEGAFSINNLLADVGPVTADVALYTDDTSSTSHLACVAPSNPDELKGKIALVYRGGCNFTDKVKDAQDAGAIGVIVADNIAGEAPFAMGGDDNSITIPAVMVTLGAGDSIRTQLMNGVTVNATLKKPVGIKLDGDLDAGVMCHEYTHGISNRFTGGPSNVSCLFNTEQMGEGWSDYDALMFTTDWTKAKVTDGAKPRPVGTYVEGEPNSGAGIRNFPYSTDMSIDPWSYEYMKITGGEAHNVGEVWCTVLWDMTWNIIQMDGINTNIFNANGAGGNSVALKLVYEGMKLQACSPGFIDGRDAILKADTMLYGGKYSCAIWNAFAKRGMGLTASEGSSDVIGDETISHSTSGLLITKYVDKDSAAQGEELTYRIVVKAAGVCGVTTVTGSVVDTLPKNTTYVTGSGGLYNAAIKTVTFPSLAIPVGDSVVYTFKATVNKGTYFAADTLFYDDPSKQISTIWNVGTNWSYANYGSTGNPDWDYFAADVNTTTNSTLTTKSTYVVPGLQTTLSFSNYIETYYAGYNGGVVEISADNGATWQDLGPYMSGFKYNSTISDAFGSPLADKDAFSGSSNGVTTINLSSFAGKKVKIRFRYVTTAGTGDDNANNDGYGWYVWNILLKAEAAVNNIAKTSLNTSSSAYTVIKDEVLPVTWESFTATKQKNTALLEWATAQEINSASFDIERSSDGLSFTKLGSQQAAGNSTLKHDYSFVDEAPLQGVNIYRIKQIDNDGKFTYSVYRPLTFDNAPSFSVTPNPAKDKVKVTVTGNTKLLHVYLMSSGGQQLKSFEMTGETKDLYLPTLASGVYHIMVKGEGVSYKKKIVIQ